MLRWVAPARTGLLALFLLWICTAASAHAAIVLRASTNASASNGSGAGSSIIYVGSGSNGDHQDGYQSSGNLQLALPDAIRANDLLVCLVESYDNVTPVIASPAGWTLLYSLSNGTQSQASLFYKFAASSNEIAPVITHNGGGGIVANCAAFRGVDTANPFDAAFSPSASNADRTVETGSLTTASANTLLLFAAHVAGNPGNLGVTASGGLNWKQSFFSTANNYNYQQGDTYQAGDNNQGGNNSQGGDNNQGGDGNQGGNNGHSQGGAAVGLDYALLPTAGAVGPIVGGFSQSENSTAAVSTGVLLALRPAQSAANGLTVKVPAGTAIGDVMLAAIALTPGRVTIAAPSGWTLKRTIVAGDSSRLAIYYRVGSGSEPASYTWSFGAAHAGAVGAIASFSGVDTANPILAESGTRTESAKAHATPSISTTASGAMLVATFSYAAAGTWTPPTGMTEIQDVASLTPPSRAGESMEMAYQIQSAAGSTGKRTAIATPAKDSGATDILALKPLSISGLDHIQIEHNGSGVICTPQTITVKACIDSACSSLYTGNTSVTLLPSSSGTSAWASNPIVFSGSAQVNLSVTSVQTVTLGTSAISPAPLNATQCYVNTAPTCNLAFATAGFAIPAIPTQTAGVTSATLSLQAVTGSSGGTCSGLSGTNTVQFAAVCNDPATCAGKQVAINGTAIAGNPAGGSLSYTDVPLNFKSNATASFILNYSDVGKINLAVRYPLGGGGNMTGNSNSFVVKPFGFTLSPVRRTADNFVNPGASGANGGVFMKAGDAFTTTVTAIAGDGSATPNFGNESVAEGVVLSQNLVAPAPANGGSAGNLDGTLLIDGSLFSNGAATVTDLSWNDAGIITLTAAIADGDYLAAGNANSTSANIGRFIPHHFTTEVTPACSSGTAFTYSGQHADVTVSAFNAGGGVTQNYDYGLGFAKSISLSNAGNPTGFSNSSLTPAMTTGSGTDTSVIYTFAAKQTTPTTLTLRAVDSDGVSSSGFSEGSSPTYSGRLYMGNAYGTELLNLPMSLLAQYYDGSRWVQNPDDSCTAINLAPTVNAAPASYSYGNLMLSNATQSFAVTATVPSLTSPLASGNAALQMSSPGMGHSGSLDLTVTAPNWLQYDWNGDGAYTDNPTARIVFGIYKNNIIDLRENY